MLLNVSVLELQGAGDNEREWSIAAVCADYRDAVDKLAEINAEYEEDFAVYTLNENARIVTHDVVDNYWGL